jgi:hypothetical protein
LFIGIIFDALQEKLLIAKEKFDKTMKLLYNVMHQEEISPRGRAKLRGKFGHRDQFQCIEGVGPFLVPFNKFIGGPESVHEGDEPKAILPALRTTMGHQRPSGLSTAGKLNLLSMTWSPGRNWDVGHACMKRKDTMWSPENVMQTVPRSCESLVVIPHLIERPWPDRRKSEKKVRRSLDQ